MSRPVGDGGLRRRVLALVAVAVLVGTVGCASDPDPTASGGAASTSAVGALAGVPSRPLPEGCVPEEPERLVPEVVVTYPHDPTAFTQGLLQVGDELYEGTGIVGRSEVRRVDLATGAVLDRSPVPGSEFGEGLSRGADGRLVQLTWRDGVAFVRDPETLEVVDRWSYEGEGWGLTTLDDGTFVLSDGSDTLTWRDGATFEPEQRVRVQRSDGPTDRLNELDWDGERIWANRWQADEILRIDPRCGTVDGVVDASSLSDAVRALPVPVGIDPPDVLNGVSVVPDSDRYLITGKRWPLLYEVRFVPAGSATPG